MSKDNIDFFYGYDIGYGAKTIISVWCDGKEIPKSDYFVYEHGDGKIQVVFGKSPTGRKWTIRYIDGYRWVSRKKGFLQRMRDWIKK
jgi:hypothetical protein